MKKKKGEVIILYHWVGDFPLKILKCYIAF